MYVFLTVLDQINICLIVREYVQVFVLRVSLCKTQQKNVRLIVLQDMLNQQLDIVLLNVSEILKPMLILPKKHVYINV